MRRSDPGLNFTKIIAVLLLAVILMTALPIGSVDAKVKNTGPFDQPLPQANSEYRLSKYDLINIVVVGFSDINVTTVTSYGADTTGAANMAASITTQNVGGFNDVVIGPDGNVNLPLVGTVKLAGLTIAEATELLTSKLGEYIKIPSMSVMVKQYGLRKIYVMGEVIKPGIYALGSDYMSIFAALSSAGGITKRGRPKHIAVVRLVGGKVQMREVNFDRFVEKQDASQNVILQDGDMVYVPKSNKIDITEDIMPLANIYFLYKALK